MPFDGILTASVVYDLNSKLIGGKIEKIYQPEQDEIVLSVHSDRVHYKLLLSSGSAQARIHLITETPPNPPEPPTFCMLLRKHLQGGRISSITQKGTERIVEIGIDSYNALGDSVLKKLIVEIMGKHSNITLVDDSQGKIIDSIKRVSIDVNRYRQILPGKEYIYPPSQNKLNFFEIPEEEFKLRIKEYSGKISSAIVSCVQGMSPFEAVNLCSLSGINNDDYSPELSPEAVDNIYSNIINAAAKIKSGSFSPCVYMNDNNTPVEFYCLESPDYSSSYKIIRFSDISSALEYYYKTKTSTNRIHQKSTDLIKLLNTALDKLYLKKSRLSEEILKAESSDVFRLKGELLLANLYQINPGAKSITVENYYDQTSVIIELDEHLSPSDNSQKYYKKYTKAKTALKEKTIQLAEAEHEIYYLESVSSLLENATDYSDIEEIRQELILGGYMKKKKSGVKVKSVLTSPYSFTIGEGFRVLAGRNNKQNDILTLKTASSKDLWFHTKDIPGTHVILFTEGREISDKILTEAASIAAYYSKGKMSENVPVDYTLVKYVRKPSGAKPGMVIFDHNKTLYVNPGIPE